MSTDNQRWFECRLSGTITFDQGDFRSGVAKCDTSMPWIFVEPIGDNGDHDFIFSVNSITSQIVDQGEEYGLAFCHEITEGTSLEAPAKLIIKVTAINLLVKSLVLVWSVKLAGYDYGFRPYS